MFRNYLLQLFEDSQTGENVKINANFSTHTRL